MVFSVESKANELFKWGDLDDALQSGHINAIPKKVMDFNLTYSSRASPCIRDDKTVAEKSSADLKEKGARQRKKIHQSKAAGKERDVKSDGGGEGERE